jgi:hypothetical protein
LVCIARNFDSPREIRGLFVCPVAIRATGVKLLCQLFEGICNNKEEMLPEPESDLADSDDKQPPLKGGWRALQGNFPTP